MSVQNESKMRIFAIFECVSWAFLIAAIVLKYAPFLSSDVRTAGIWAVAVTGALHGVVTLFYLFFGFAVFFSAFWKMRFKFWFLCLLSAVIPFASIFFERKYASQAEHSSFDRWISKRPVFLWSLFLTVFAVVLTFALTRVIHA